MSTSPTRPARRTFLALSLLTPVLFLSPKLPGVPNNPYGVTGMLNVDRGGAPSTTDVRSWNNYLSNRYRTRGSSPRLF